jgi:hypothetical protein
MRGWRSSGVRRDATVVVAIAGVCPALGCADLLDIPSEPRLAPATAYTVSPVQLFPGEPLAPPSGGTGSGASRASSREGTETGDLELQPPALPRASGSGPRSVPTPDAGLAGAAVDAGVVATGPDCGRLATLGPDDRCYAFLAIQLTWPAARGLCQLGGAGWDLAAIHDAATDAFVAALARGDAWIGATDAAAEGDWKWVDDAAPFWRGGATGVALSGAYQHWSLGEPGDGADSDCALVSAAADNTWQDRRCFTFHSSVCEGPLPGQ